MYLQIGGGCSFNSVLDLHLCIIIRLKAVVPMSVSNSNT